MAENLCFTAMKRFKEQYGEIPNVSDKKFFTNSSKALRLFLIELSNST